MGSSKYTMYFVCRIDGRFCSPPRRMQKYCIGLIGIGKPIFCRKQPQVYFVLGQGRGRGRGRRVAIPAMSLFVLLKLR